MSDQPGLFDDDERLLRESIPTRPSPPGMALPPNKDPLASLTREQFTHNPEGPAPDNTQGPTAQWHAYLTREAAKITAFRTRATRAAERQAPAVHTHGRRAS